MTTKQTDKAAWQAGDTATWGYGMTSRPVEAEETDPLAGARALVWALVFAAVFWGAGFVLLLRGVERIR